MIITNVLFASIAAHCGATTFSEIKGPAHNFSERTKVNQF